MSYCDMYTSESCAQVFAWILRECTTNWERFRYIGYDRACELDPFVNRLHERGNVGATDIAQNTQFLVDIWHCKKHTRTICMPLHDNPQCRYHPRLEKFKQIHGTNTECAEQAFSWMGKFKASVKKMGKHRFRFFLGTVINLF